MLRFKKLDPNGNLTRGSEHAAGYDLYAIYDFDIPKGELIKVKTGISIEIPNGYLGLIRDRSSIGSKGITVFAGVIDSDYRGEIVLCMCNVSNPNNTFLFKRGEKVAQMIIVPCFQDEPIESDDLSDTKRGSGGFGSTGK